MADRPHIAKSACKYGVDYLDVYSVLDDPLLAASMADVVEMAARSGVPLDEQERPNVDVFAGRDSSGDDLVVLSSLWEKSRSACLQDGVPNSPTPLPLCSGLRSAPTARTFAGFPLPSLWGEAGGSGVKVMVRHLA